MIALVKMPIEINERKYSLPMIKRNVAITETIPISATTPEHFSSLYLKCLDSILDRLDLIGFILTDISQTKVRAGKGARMIVIILVSPTSLIL